MKAVILAGGKGTRLADISNGKPKPLMKIGGRTVLDHQLEMLSKHGIQEVVLLIGYKGEMIIEYCGDGSQWGLCLSFIKEKSALGTSGAVKAAERILQEDDFLLLYGDVMLDMDLQELVEFHRKSNAHATLVIHPNDHPHDSDLVEIDATGRINGWLPKSNRKQGDYANLVNAAIYVLSPKILNWIPEGNSDFGSDIFPLLLDKGLYVAGYKTSEYIKDMGTLERWKKVNRDFKSGLIQRRNLKKIQKAIFLDRDGTINKENGLLYKVDQMEIIFNADKAISEINRKGYLAICLTNQSVIARNLCDFDELQMIHNRMDRLLGEASCYLDDLFFCPHHPDSGYPEERKEYKVLCQCRKPAIGMVKQAVAKYNLDLSQCWMIGDRGVDIQLAQNCGMKSILVQTGFISLIDQQDLKPDFIAKDLFEAVKHIITNVY
jgi:histidinol-phosphate phosphatase family protein